MTELHYLSATKALDLFRIRQLSPVELTQALIARAEAVEPVVNALAERMFERALEEAAEAERRYAGGGAEARPLEGLPVAMKEEHSITGHTNSEGTLLRTPRVATSTDVLPARVLEAGGIVHARTTTAEFCCLPMSHTARWGVTRNPWNLQASAGGSSGGSAASLASGTSVLASGTDIGGSIRAPAAFNGLVGFKPPHGRNPTPVPSNLDTFYHQGPLARTVADCALLQNVLTGPDQHDRHSLLPAIRIPDRLDDVRGLRVAYCDAPGDFPVDPEIRKATSAAAHDLRAEGAKVEEVRLLWQLADVKRALAAHGDVADALRILELARLQPDKITPYTHAFATGVVEMARRVGVDEGRKSTAAIRDQLTDVFERFDVLIMPTVGAIAFAAGEDYIDTKLVVDGTELEHFADASLTPVFNICSSHPVVGSHQDGRPTACRRACRSSRALTTTSPRSALPAPSNGLAAPGSQAAAPRPSPPSDTRLRLLSRRRRDLRGDLAVEHVAQAERVELSGQGVGHRDVEHGERLLHPLARDAGRIGSV